MIPNWRQTLANFNRWDLRERYVRVFSEFYHSEEAKLHDGTAYQYAVQEMEKLIEAAKKDAWKACP